MLTRRKLFHGHKTGFWAVCAGAWSLAMAVHCFAGNSGDDPKPTVGAIRAHLYYQGSGTCDARNILDPGFVLWNVVIGGGDAAEASDSVLAVVEIRISKGRQCEGCSLEFLATTEERTLEKATVPLRVEGASGVSLWSPFLIRGVGCELVDLRARVVGSDGVMQPWKSARIPFKCGE